VVAPLRSTTEDEVEPPAEPSAPKARSRPPRSRAALATRLWQLEVERTRLRIVRAARRAGWALWLGAIGLAVTVTAAVLAVQGLAAALGSLFGRAWAGDLAAAAAVLGGLALVARAVFARADRATLARLRRRFGDPDEAAGSEQPDRNGGT
jgi:hypothetical protein